MELSKIIEMMQDADVKNGCEYSMSISTRDWLGKQCAVGFVSEKIGGSIITRQMPVNAETDESGLLEFLSSSDAAKNKLDAAIAARDKLNAEIAAMGGETIICNEVKS